MTLEVTFLYAAIMISIGCGSYYMRMLQHTLCQNLISRISVRSRFIITTCMHITFEQYCVYWGGGGGTVGSLRLITDITKMHGLETR